LANQGCSNARNTTESELVAERNTRCGLTRNGSEARASAQVRLRTSHLLKAPSQTLDASDLTRVRRRVSIC
jgi:hypothetical protein